jgi:Zn-finger nucleic acid-binding protein
MELEPLLDVTDAPCPRCRLPLEAAGGAGGWADARVHECPRCGGLFVPRDALAELLCRAELAGPFPEPLRAPTLALEQVRYIPCPQCHATMNRVNFGKVSGVIVDVCRAHGTWFDGGELTRVVSFAASGGLTKARRREEEEKKEAAAAARHPAHPVHGPYGSRSYEANERLEEWRTFLRELLWW